MYFLFNIIFLYSQYQLSIATALFHSAIVTSIMGFAEIGSYIILNHLAPDFLLAAGPELIVYALVSKLVFFLVIYILSFVFRKNRNESAGHQDHLFLLLLFIPLSSMVIMLTFIRIVQEFQFSYPLNIYVPVCSVLLLFVNLLVLGLNQYTTQKNSDFTKMQLELQKEYDLIQYYKLLVAQNENQKILIHDIKKHLQSLDHLNSNSDSEMIHAYIQQLLNSTELKTSSRICDNELLNAILCHYQNECNEKHILFNTDIRKNMLPTVSHDELTSLFCNLLDNAFTACENIPEAFIDISVTKKTGSPYTVIVIINSCRKSPVFDSDHLPVSSRTSDGKYHGYGVKSICKIVNAYHGNIQMYYDEENAQFHTIIMLKDI